MLLIANQEKLAPANQEALEVYLEKVVDETVNLAPTATEACDVALSSVSEPVRSLLAANFQLLGVSNIRVISRVSDLGVSVGSILQTLPGSVLKEAIKTLVLFGAARFLAADGFPTVAHLMQIESVWATILAKPKAEDAKTADDRKHAEWGELLTRYGYGATSEFDTAVGQGVQQGFFDEKELLKLGAELAKAADAQALREEFHAKWTKFWHSLDGSGAEVLEEMREVTERAMSAIGVGDLRPVYEVFVEAGEEPTAKTLLNRFIATHRDEPAAFEAVDGAFRDNYTGEFADRLRAERARLAPKPSVLASLDAIDLERGWDPDDVSVVAAASAAEVQDIIRKSSGRLFRARVRTLLGLGRLHDATPAQVAVSAATVAFLKGLADVDPVAAVRLRQYLPVAPAAGGNDAPAA